MFVNVREFLEKSIFKEWREVLANIKIGLELLI